MVLNFPDIIHCKVDRKAKHQKSLGVRNQGFKKITSISNQKKISESLNIKMQKFDDLMPKSVG